MVGGPIWHVMLTHLLRPVEGGAERRPDPVRDGVEARPEDAVDLLICTCVL